MSDNRVASIQSSVSTQRQRSERGVSSCTSLSVAGSRPSTLTNSFPLPSPSTRAPFGSAKFGTRFLGLMVAHPPKSSLSFSFPPLSASSPSPPPLSPRLCHLAEADRGAFCAEEKGREKEQEEGQEAPGRSRAAPAGRPPASPATPPSPCTSPPPHRPERPPPLPPPCPRPSGGVVGRIG